MRFIKRFRRCKNVPYSKTLVSLGHGLVETKIQSWGGAEGISKNTLFSSVMTGLLTRNSTQVINMLREYNEKS